MNSWGKATVGELADQIRGVSYAKSDAASEALPGYVPILRATNITDAGLDLAELVYVPEERVSPDQMLRRNDIVIAASSGSADVVGKAAQVRTSITAGFGAFCKVLRPKPQVDPAYFAHYFRTPTYRRTVSALAAGININNLRNEHLDDLTIPVPSRSEQRRIASILDAANSNP